MALAAVGPVQHDVGRRHQLNFHHPRVDWVLAGIERRDPHALVANIDQIAMLKVLATHIDMLFADIRDHHTNIANWDRRHRHLLDPNKPRVEVP